MASKNECQKLGHRVAEEMQLLAEEKWIMEALVKIKNQRNCLQIERLHLESLKAKLKMGKNEKQEEQKLNMEDDCIASTSAVNLMQTVTSGKAIEETVDLSEDFCNDEELNLRVSSPVYSRTYNENDDFMEEDEESEDDTFIDMNMLMNGTLK